MKSLDRPFWAVFLAVAITGTITWLAIFEHNYHPWIYTCNEEVTTLQVGESELDFNRPPGRFTIWWESGRKVIDPPQYPRFTHTQAVGNGRASLP